MAAADTLLRLEYPLDLAAVLPEGTTPADAAPEAGCALARAAAMRGRAAEEDAWIETWLDGVASDSADVRRRSAEALARLGSVVSLNDDQRQRLFAVADEAAEDTDDPTTDAYIAWAAARAGHRPSRTSLLERLADEDARHAAAEALIALSTTPDFAGALQPQDVAGDGTTARLAGLAYSDAESLSADDKQAVFQAAVEGSANDQLLLARLLAAQGDGGELPLLKTLMSASDASVRVAAAAAVCQIDRRAPRRLARLDWLVVAAYGVGMLAIGWYFARRSATSDDYLLGGRQMKSGAVGLSLFATLLSTITYLSTPGEMIRNGPMMLCQIAAYPLVILVVGWGLIPFLRRVRITSAYELLENRFGLGVRILGSTFFLMLRLLWMSVIIYATTTKVLVPLLGIPPSYAPLVGSVLGIVTIIYTTMGGLQAVIWTDVTQTAVLFFGAILSILVITVALGGVDQWWPHEWAPSWQRFVWFDPEKRISFFGITLAVLTWQICTNGSDQMAIQRYLSCASDGAARRAQMTAMAADATVALLLGMLGFALFAYFTANPHLLADGATIRANADQLLPRFVVIGLPQGVSGLVVAGLLAAAMSSLSSGVNSSSSVITVDYIERFGRRSFSDAEQVRIARYVSLAVGVVVVAVSVLLSRSTFANLFEVAYKVTNFFTAPLFGLFFMAFFVRWATSLGTIVGAATGVAVCFVINYWEAVTDEPRIVGFIWATPLCLVSQIIVGCVVSACERAVRRT
ncbi:MAG: sodium/solute symporter [Planctomycetales bacterium]|nr:sodium/solute symporter [Planctomycetales bacterium]